MLAKIDVIIPCYNAALTLPRAIESVLAQDFLSTLWLIDDASTYGTLAVANAFAEQYPDRIKVEKWWCGKSEKLGYVAIQQ